MRVFISHIAEEAPLALTLKNLIESTFSGQLDVFASSDSEDIPPGARWLQRITDALAESTRELQ